ncbi:glycoside hydrolase family 6 protein [Granulicella sp. S156]|uniref:glycoside hydrolase family 6 protein n=1 Tax=Granulicella sp. S156 TaxID=1747224 RepID=UPI00131B9D69|nr:glycoside hydrolase family 6 protein [Granulicella sp. S156]
MPEISSNYPSIRRVLTSLVAVVALLSSITPGKFANAQTSTDRTISTSTLLFVPQPQAGAVQQEVGLLQSGQSSNALLINAMEFTPQSVWLASKTPSETAAIVTQTLLAANAQTAVPVFVLYNIPGRDCGSYSAGGAQNTPDYEAWINAIAGAIGNEQVVVLVEPDSLALLPSDCGYDPTVVDIPTAVTNRYSQINYAITQLEQQPQASVYIDAGNSHWQAVPVITQRLITAGVQQAQGYFSNVSNFHLSTYESKYDTWISECIAFGTNSANGGWRLGHYSYCASQYYSQYGTVNPDDITTWSYTDEWFENNLGTAVPTTHFVIDTSRNGLGPFDASSYANSPYNQPASVITTLDGGDWCNPPARGLGVLPTVNTGTPLLDAYLWVKTPGLSDGTCDSAGGARAWDYADYQPTGWPTTTLQATFDPLWSTYDPTAGVWFSNEALDLVQRANPAITGIVPAGTNTPAITTQPTSESVALGTTATFVATATGSSPLAYQWFENGVAIQGATSASFTTPVLAVTDNGEQYSVAVTNAAGITISTMATLTVSAPAVNNTNVSDTAIPGYGSGPVPAGANLVIGQTATSSSNQAGWLGVSNAVDANLTTRWSSAFIDPSWVQVDLGSVQSIGQVVLRWERAFGIVYQIQVSSDAVNWTTVFTQTNGSGGTENLVFSPISGRYVRMYGTQRATQYGYSLWEFEVYGPGATAASTPTAPTIDIQPGSMTSTVSSTAIFSVTASGTAPFTYQWFENGVAIPGATNAIFTTSVLAATDNGDQFDVTVSNALGTANSTVASLTVNPAVAGESSAPVITIPPSSQSVAVGATATFTVSQAGTAPFNYQWLENGLAISGATSAIFTTPVLATSDNGEQYSVTVSNATGSTTSVAAILTVNASGSSAPAFTTQPTSQSVAIGTAATFTVTFTGTPPFTYQWFENGVAISGATSAFFTTPVLAAADNGEEFSVTVSNGAGVASSTTAFLTVSVTGTDNTNGSDTAISGYGTGPLPGGSNLALGQSATSSGNESGGLSASNAVDGDLTTRWSSAFVDPSWIQIDLGSVQTIGQVVLRWERAFGVVYQIQVSSDGLNWTTVFTQTNGSGGSENLVFSPINGRYVRMCGTQRATQYGYSLWEFEVYGQVI